MKLLVLFALVACVLADGHDAKPELYEPDHPRLDLHAGMNAKKACCLPDQYHFKVAMENAWKDGEGNHGMSKQMQENWVDFEAGMFAGKEMKVENGKVTNTTFVADFNQKYMKVYDHESRQCYWFDIPGAITGQCFNQNAEFQGSYSIGAGDRAISTDSWMAGFMEEGIAMKMELGVTSQGCVPVFSNLEGEMGDYQFKTSSMYFDTMRQIPDAMVFDPPAACMDAMRIDTPDAVKAMAYIDEKFFPSSNPHKCCFPMSWEGSMSQQTGAQVVGVGAVIIRTHVPHVAVNYEYMKFAITEYISFNGVPAENLTYIGDMRYGVMYQLNIDTKVCKKYSIPSVNKEMKTNCIPSSAEFVGSTSLGLKDGGLPISTWKMMYSTANLNMTVDMAVTSTDDGVCVPISELSYGMNKDQTSFMSSNAFLNLKAGVEDPEVFHPPEACSGAAIESLPEDLTDTLEMMIKRLTNM